MLELNGVGPCAPAQNKKADKKPFQLPSLGRHKKYAQQEEELPLQIELAPPAKMSRPRITPLNSYAVSISWTPPADFAAQIRALGAKDQPHPALLGYKLRYCFCEAISQTFEVEQEWGPGDMRAVLKHLHGGRRYYFQVAAYNNIGLGPWSDLSDLFHMPDAGARNDRLTRDLNFSGINFGDGPAVQESEETQRPKTSSKCPDSIDVRWDAPCDRGAKIIAYDILYSKSDSFKEPKTLRVDGSSKEAKLSNLEPNTTYFFKHRAVNEVGASEWSEASHGICTTAKPPEAPTPPRFESAKASQLRISWDPPMSYGIPVQKYRVRFSTSPQMENSRDVSMPDAKPGTNPATTVRIKSLRPLTQYYFQVMAVNQIGPSAWSKSSSAMRTESSPPAQINAPQFVDATIDTITIEWEPPDSYGSKVEQYHVRMSTHSFFVDAVEYHDVAVQHVGKTVRTTIEKCLPPGIQHYFQVRSLSVGYSAWSSTSEAMYTRPERPEAPRPPANFTPLPRAIVVHWNPPPNNGSPITEYQLRWDTCSDMRNAVMQKGMKGAKTSQAVTGLQPHTSYFFQVKAANIVGWSTWSLPSRPVQVVQEPPTKPAAPSLLECNRTSVTVAFTKPADHGTLDGRTIQSYTMRYTEDPTLLESIPANTNGSTASRFGFTQSATHDDTMGGKVFILKDVASPVQIKGLLPGRKYYFQVYASNQFGAGEWSDASETAMATEPSVPEAPKTPKMVESTSQSIVLQWHPPVDNGAPLIKYLVRVLDEHMKGAPIDLHPIEHVEQGLEKTPNGTYLQHYNANGLLPGTKYCFRVAALNTCGRSDWSDPTEPFRTEPTAPLAPGEPTAQETGTHHFIVKWPVPRDNGAAIEEYTVMYTDHSSWERNVTIKKTTNTWFQIDDCTAGCLYYIKVCATNAIGTGEFSEMGRVRTQPSVPAVPAAPLVAPNDIGPTSIHLTWAPCYDGGDKLKGYKVLHRKCDEDESGSDEGEVFVQGSRRGIDITGLEAGLRYRFLLAAVNGVGQSDWSEPTRVIRTLPPQPPAKTEAPYMLKATSHGMEIGWMPALDNGAPITEQVIKYSRDPEMKHKVQEIVIAGVQTRRCSQLDPGAVDPGESQADKDEGVAGLINRMKKLKEQRKSIEKLEPGTTYYFVVQSANCIGYSPVSDVSDGLTTEPFICEAIKKLDLCGVASKWLQFAWSPPEDNGAPVIKYNLRYSQSKDGLGDDGDFKEVSVTVQELKETQGGQCQFKIKGLEPGESYWASIQALNQVGASPWTVMSHLAKTNCMEPTQVEQIEAVSQSTSSVKFKWKAPNPRGTPLTAYEINWMKHEFQSLCPWPTDGETYEVRIPEGLDRFQLQEIQQSEITGLLPGSSVRLCIRARNFEGFGEWSDWIGGEGFVSKSMGPLSPETPQLVADKNQLTPYSFAMQFVIGRPNGTGLTNFHFRYGTDSALTQGVQEWSEEVTDPTKWREADTYHFNISKLRPGTYYWAQVAQENIHGMSSWSPISDGVRTLPDVPLRPVPPYSNITTPSSIEVKWFPPHDSGAPILGYMLRYLTPKKGWYDDPAVECTFEEDSVRMITEEDIGTGDCIYELGGLEPGVAYYFSLCCRNSVGWSTWSPPSRGFITKPTRPDAPIKIDLSDVTPISMNICWEVPAEHGAPIERYEVVASQSVRLLRWMYFTAKITSRTADSSRLFGSSEDLDVGESVNEDRIGEVNFDGAYTTVLPPEQTSCKLDGLVPGRTYYVIVRAKNSAGKGNWSVPIGPLLTESTVPARSTRLEPMELQPTSCALVITLPYDNGAKIEQCIIRTKRIFGPIAETEMKDPQGTSNQPHDHIAEREDSVDPRTCQKIEVEWGETPGQVEEGLVHVLESLLPGTDYQVKWCAVNRLGRGLFSPSIVITTLPHIPDRPRAALPHNHD